MPSSLRLDLDWASYESAKHACLKWHYSRAIPAGKLVGKIGVWEDSLFKGVVIFSRGSNHHIGSPYGLNQTEVCELTRVALKDHRTPVSRIISIAIRFLRKQSPGLRLIVSYADPAQGHHGGIYQAGGWFYVGKGSENQHLLIDGKQVHKRTACSVYGTVNPIEITAKTGLPAARLAPSAKLTYLMPLDASLREKLKPLRKTYPKRAAESITA